MPRFYKHSHAFVAVAIGVYLILCSPSVSWADFKFYLSAPNASLSTNTGPFGSVDVHLTDSTHATITLMSNTVGEDTYLFGGRGTLDLNVNANSFSAGDFQSAQPTGKPFKGWMLNGTGTGKEGGFGKFDLSINSRGGFARSVDELSFVLTNSGGSWSAASDVLKPNNDGFIAAGHVYVWDTAPGNSDKGHDCNPVKGFAGGVLPGGPPEGPLVDAAPAPSSIILTAMGCACLLGVLSVTRARRARLL
jgi:hypothetical protein